MDDGELLAGLSPDVLLTRVLAKARAAERLRVDHPATVTGVWYREIAAGVLALDAALRRGEPWPLAWAGDRARPVADVDLIEGDAAG